MRIVKGSDIITRWEIIGDKVSSIPCWEKDIKRYLEDYTNECFNYLYGFCFIDKIYGVLFHIDKIHGYFLDKTIALGKGRIINIDNINSDEEYEVDY